MRRLSTVSMAALVTGWTATSAAATYYVDGSLPAGGTHDGKSWSTAWRSPADVATVAPGDTVYISGGPSGSSVTYTGVNSGNGATYWKPQGGSAGNPVTYRIGQDPAHNGTAVFDGGGQQYWLGYPDYNTMTGLDNLVISGGPSGSSVTYTGVNSGNGATYWKPQGGSAGNPVTYRIGQDPAHNGTAVFDGGGQQYWLGYPDYNTMTGLDNLVISGDAGDGMRHISVKNYSTNMVEGDMAENLRISYIDFGQCGDGPLRFIPSNGGLEIDHCYAYIADLTADHFSQGQFNGTAFDQNSAHDNEIHLPRAADTGDGADGFQWSGSGFSIHHNVIAAYVGAYTGGQHQDGAQPLGASYVKIYANTISDMANSAIFLDGYGDDFTHVWVYDNVITGGGVGIAGGPDSGALQGLGRWPNFTDVVIANNTTADTWNVEPGVALWIDPYIAMSQGVTPTTKFTQCVVSNNVTVNAADAQIDSSITSADNVTLSASEAPSHFVKYAMGASSYDLHLASTDDTLRGHGTNLSMYFGSDHDNVPRPSSGAWDVGAYVYCNGGCAPAGTGGGGTGGGTPGGGAGSGSHGGCSCGVVPEAPGGVGLAAGLLGIMAACGARRRRRGQPLGGGTEALPPS